MGCGAGPSASPGLTVAVAEVTSSGLWSRSFGYARNASLCDRDGAEDDVTEAPAAPSTTISFQPILSP